MPGPARPLIWRAILVRAEKPTPEPRTGILQIVFFHKNDTPCLLPNAPDGLRVELHFADGLGSEVWRESRRSITGGTILTLELDPYRRPSLGAILLTDGAKPQILRQLEGFTVSAPNTDLPDLRFCREAHPKSTVFISEEPANPEESAMAKEPT